MLQTTSTTQAAALPPSVVRTYIIVLTAAALLVFAAFMTLGLRGRDHFASFRFNGDSTIYRDFAGRHVPEIQDQDLFFNNIGGSITAAKKSDIVLLGPSFVAYGFDRDTLRAFEAASSRRVYNMSFLGIRGGEFSRQIITRWNVRAPLWVINVDDQFIHFFSRSLDLTLGPQTLAIPAATRSRWHGYVSAAGRNLRWRVEDIVAAITTGNGAPSGIFRNVLTGDTGVDINPKYLAGDNTVIPFDRGRECHASPATIEIARQYLNDIGGQVVFTLVPHSQYCPNQARELAAALGVEIILPPDEGYTSVDGGGHLDKRSAVRFSRFVLSELVKTKAYRLAFGNDKVMGEF